MEYLKLRQGGVGMVQILQLNWQLTKVELTGPCLPTHRALKANVLPCHRNIGQPPVASAASLPYTSMRAQKA